MAVQWFKTNNLVKEHDLYERFIKERQEQLRKRNLSNLDTLFPKIKGLRWSNMKNSEYWAIRKWHCITISYTTWAGICAKNGEIQPYSNSYKKFVDLNEESIKLFKAKVTAAITSAGCDYNNLHPNQTVFDPCRYLAMYWTYLDIIKDTTADRYYPNSKTRSLAAKVFGYAEGEDPFHMNGKYCTPIEKTNDQPEEKKSVDVTVVPQEISIRDLDLSGKAYNPLWRHGIRTLGDILKLTTNDILHIRNVGITVFREIAKKVEEYGYFYPTTNKNVAAQPIGSGTVKFIPDKSSGYTPLYSNKSGETKTVAEEKADYQTEYLRVLSQYDALKANYDKLRDEYGAKNKELDEAKEYITSLGGTIRKLTMALDDENKDILDLITNVVRMMKVKKMDWLYLTLDGMTIDIHGKESVEGHPRVSYTIRTREE